MPSDLRIKVGKIMTIFIQHLLKKQQKLRVDVYMENLKQISNKEIYEIDDRDGDVLEFLTNP